MLAAPISNAIAQLQEWNLISFNNYIAQNEVEGRVFVGGDMVNANSQFNFRGTTPSANGTAAVTVVGNSSGSKIDYRAGDIVVGGNQSASTLEINGSDNRVYVGGTESSSTHNNAIIQQNLATTNSSFTSTLNNQKNLLVNSLTSLSSNLRALSSTGSFSTADNALTFNASSGMNVLNITVDQINQFAQNYIDIVSPNGSTTVINVSGSGTISRNFNSQSSAKNIIWNFYDATALTLGNWQGTVLATNADFVKDVSGAINGTVAAKSVANYAEVHSYAFQGNLGALGAVTAAPEPSTWGMLVIGFGLVGATLRRRAKRKLVLSAI